MLAARRMMIPSTIAVLLDWMSTGWFYKPILASNSTDYSSPSYDDSGWSSGQAPFGGANYDGSGETFNNGDYAQDARVWLRRQFGTLDVPSDAEITVKIRINNFIGAWWNGTALIDDPSTDFFQTVDGEPLTINVPAAAVGGDNVLAIRATDNPGGTPYPADSAHEEIWYIDARVEEHRDINAPDLLQRTYGPVPGSATTTQTATLPGAVTDGSTLVALIGEYDARSSQEVTSVSGCGATWSRAVRSSVLVDGIAFSIWIGRNCSGGDDTITTTANAGMQNEIQLAEFTGLDNTVTGWRTNSTTTGGGTTVSSGALRGNPGDLIIGGWFENNDLVPSDTSTPGAWTLLTDTGSDIPSGYSHPDFYAAFLVMSSTGSHEYAATVSSAVLAAGCVAIIPHS